MVVAPARIAASTQRHRKSCSVRVPASADHSTSGTRLRARVTEAITISTVGLVPQIRRYAREGHKYRLIVSLTSAIAETRRKLLPVAGNFGLDEVAGAIREYAAVAPGRITIAWVLMGGVNVKT